MEKKGSRRFQLNPLIVVGVYVPFHIAFTILHVYFTPDNGGESFEFVAKSINMIPEGILLATIISSFVYYKWAVKYWWLTMILILIGFSGLITYAVRRYFYHWDGPYW